MQPRRPPSLPSAWGVFPGLSSFPPFERDPRGHSESPCSDIVALRDRLPTGGQGSAEDYAKVFLGYNARLDNLGCFFDGMDNFGNLRLHIYVDGDGKGPGQDIGCIWKSAFGVAAPSLA
jgi:hypothetical protein